MPNRIGTSTVEPNIANKCCKLSGIVLSNFGLSSTAIKSLFFKKSSPVLKLDIKKGPFKAPKIHARASYTCINLTLSRSEERRVGKECIVRWSSELYKKKVEIN